MENTITQQITKDELWDLLDDIKLSWSGYLWQDDQSTPFIFKNEVVNYRKYFTSNIPFIIEGLLVNTKETISLTIKNIDGVYYCYKSINFKDLKPVETFPADKALEDEDKGIKIKALEFIPIFKKQNDPFSGKFPKENSEKSKDSERFQEYVYSHQIFKGINS